MKIPYLVLALILVSGCISQMTCNPPYILVGDACCLDRNDNKICDFEDITTTSASRTTTTTTFPVTTTIYITPSPSSFKGYFERLEVSRSQVYINELVEIKATFQNQGDSVLVSFKGKAESDGRTVALIQSPESVPAGKNITITAFFTPTKAGRYSISGKMYYEYTSTNERSTILNVIER